jgi:hypothetical protein
MTKRPKRPRDTNQLAKLIVDIASGQAKKESPPLKPRGGVATKKKSIKDKRRR